MIGFYSCETRTKRLILSIIICLSADRVINLPNKVTFDSGEEITWVYDAAGVKLYKISTNAAPTSVSVRKDYLGGIEYADNVVEAIYHSEGRAVPNGTDYTFEYTLKDHLGNSRVTFADLDKDGEVDASEILQANHYYPFGMAMELPSQPMGNPNNAYQYNGKELNSDFGLDWLDYGARWYDASIGRWSAVDPLAEKHQFYSPFNYVLNNPMIIIDPDGKDTSFVNNISREQFIQAWDDIKRKKEMIKRNLEKAKNKKKENKKERLTKKLARWNEMDASFEEIVQSKVMFVLEATGDGSGITGGSTSIDFDKENTINIKFCKNCYPTIVHEVRHGAGYLRGEIFEIYDLDKKQNVHIAYDYQDEFESYILANEYASEYDKERVNKDISRSVATYGNRPLLNISTKYTQIKVSKKLIQSEIKRLGIKNVIIPKYLKLK